MGINKKNLKTKAICKITFTIADYPDATSACLVGTFNNWNAQSHIMKKMKNGSFKISVDLPCKGRHEFRYLIDGYRWENEAAADGEVLSPFGDSFNSLINT